MTDSPRPTDASVLTSVQAALGQGFQVERELGGGGMSRVFIAMESALGRRVAVKVLSPNLFEGVSVERFAREVAVVAQLQNPHIVPVLAAGTTADGLPWYTMPFIEGESLRARLQRGPIPLDEALRILRDVAEALEYAHGRGIVHRDIKPENVLLSGRSALVTDFGIAKAVSSVRDAATGGALTSVGLSLGTPAYMSPEQVAADPVDHRTDLYAWGIMAYEVLAGRHPFSDRTQAQVMAAHIAEMPTSLAELRPELPTGLCDLVMRCVAKLPAARPADASALLSTLGAQTTPVSMLSAARPSQLATAQPRPRGKMMAAAAAVLLLGATAWAAVSGTLPFADGGSGRAPSLAVLPFEHQGDSADIYLTEGITDEIRNKLIGVRELVVIARASSNAYRGSTKTPREIAEELGVRWLLTGTVRVSGSGAQRHVIVRPELVEITKAGQPQSRWGEPFDVTGADVLSLQGSVATQVVSAMEVPIAAGADRAQLIALPTRDAQAYDLYLRGRAATNFGLDLSISTVTKAAALYEQALARDSQFVLAWSAFAIMATNLHIVSPSANSADRARRAAERAIALDPNGASGNKAMGVYQLRTVGDLKAATPYLEQSVRADSTDVGAALNLAIAQLDAGRIDEGISLLESTLRRDPLHPNLLRRTAHIYLLRGRFDEARTLLTRLRAVAPAAAAAIDRTVMLALFEGDTLAARQTVVDALKQVPANSLMPALLNAGFTWVPDPALLRTFLAQGPGIVGPEDRSNFFLWQADFAFLTKDVATQRRWADSARRILGARVADAPDGVSVRAEYAQSLALAGRGAEAVTELKRALALLLAQGVDRRGLLYVQSLEYASTVAMNAGNHDAALDFLEELQSGPLHYSPAYLRVNAYYAPLRGNPRFERLIAQAR